MREIAIANSGGSFNAAQPQPGGASLPRDRGVAIRNLLWVYIVLLLVEGALRKWFLPSLSSELLFVREPVVLLIYILAVAEGIFPSNKSSVALYAVTIFATINSLAANLAYPLVTIYGFKANFLHLPLIFVIPAVFTRRDVIAVGKLFLLVGIITLPVSIMQYRTAPESIWNVGAAGLINGQITGALGKVRPAGIFSFVTGNSMMCATMTAFIVYGLLELKSSNRILVVLGGVAMILTVALSISRTTIVAVSLVVSMVVVLAVIKRSYAGKVTTFAALFGVMLFGVSSLSLFQEGKEGMMGRLENTGDIERGVYGTALDWSARIGGDLISGFHAAVFAPMFGYGIGYGTNGGSTLMTGQLKFLLAEGEWARAVLEMGPVLGFIYLGIRVAIVLSMLMISLRAGRLGNPLPLLLFGVSGWLVFSGQFGQGTTTGFAVLTSGLCLAACNLPGEHIKRAVAGAAVVRVKSQSRYSEFLHGRAGI